MLKRTLLHLLIPAAALLLGLACGGARMGPGPVVAPASTGLVYKNPDSGGWALIRNAGSSDTRLILDLVGPSGQKGRGVGFNLQTDGTVNFGRLGAAGYIADAGVFKLQSYQPNYFPSEPTLLAGGVKQNGTLLTAGIFQKDRYWPAQKLDQPLCQIAIEFDAVHTAALAPGTAIPLTITKARAIPDKIGVPPADPTDPNADWSSVYYAYGTSIQNVQIAVGTLTTK